MARAAVSSEDARFFLHDGFDWEAICGALDDYGDGKLRGGSTISQQVARNVFLWQERSWLRKGLETWYTFWLELLVPKERILELYLNVAETGPMTFGFEAGAQRWYHQPASGLTRAQAAGLAAILPSPRKWSPTRAPASTRAAWILANPAPFPGDKGYDALVEKWDREGRGPWMCAPRSAPRADRGAPAHNVRTYSNSSGRPSIPWAGAAIQPAIFPGSTTGFMSEPT